MYKQSLLVVSAVVTLVGCQLTVSGRAEKTTETPTPETETLGNTPVDPKKDNNTLTEAKELRLIRLRANGEPAAPNTDPALSTLFRDTELNTECSFVQVGDPDNFRCIPKNAQTPSVYFTDETCTQPIAVLGPPTCGSPTYALALREDTFDVYKIGASKPKPAVVYEFFFGDCTEVSMDQTKQYFAVAATTGNEFAHAKLELLGDLRLKQTHLVPDEGRAFVDPFWNEMMDVQTGKTCGFDIPTGTCMSYFPPVLDVYSDNACATSFPAIASKDAKIVETTSGELRFVTSLVEHDNFYIENDGLCESGESGEVVYEPSLGDIFTPASGTVVTIGTGRVRERRIESNGLSVFVDYFDTLTNTPCEQIVTTDLKIRCYHPADWYSYSHAEYFTDAACTHAILAGFDSDDVPDVLQISDEPCSNHARFARVGAKIPEAASTAPLYAKTTEDASCTELEYPEELPDRYEQGALVVPTEIPEIP